MLPSLALKPPERTSSPRNWCLTTVFLPSQEDCVPQNLRQCERDTPKKRQPNGVVGNSAWLPHRSAVWGTQITTGDPERIRCPLAASRTTVCALITSLYLKPCDVNWSLQYQVQIPWQHSRSSRMQTQHLFPMRSIKHHHHHTGLWLTDPQPPLGVSSRPPSFTLCFFFCLPEPGHCLFRLLT